MNIEMFRMVDSTLFYSEMTVSDNVKNDNISLLSTIFNWFQENYQLLFQGQTIMIQIL